MIIINIISLNYIFNIIYYIQVKDWCFPGCAPKESLKEHILQKKLVIVSGLDLSNNYKSLGISLFLEWLCGMAGNTTIQKDNTSIVRLIIAGKSYILF